MGFELKEQVYIAADVTCGFREEKDSTRRKSWGDSVVVVHGMDTPLVRNRKCRKR